MTIFWHVLRRERPITTLAAITMLVLAMLIAATRTPAANANTAIQPLSSITAAVASASKAKAEQQGYSNITVDVRPLDSRLRLPLCNEPLSTFSPSGSDSLGATSVGVRCSGEKSWTIYARTNVSAQKAIPLLSRPLPRNTLITKSDIVMTDQPVQASMQGVITDPSQIIGMELTRALNAGSPIKPNQLRAPKIITRGQQVILVSGTNGLEVRMQGKALKDATAGERVKVTNLSSGQQIEGIANTDGTVSVP